MPLYRPILIFSWVAVTMGACAPVGMYEWGGYQDRLYSYYKDPEEIGGLVKALESTISRGEKSKRVPPGMYAEYGYLLMVQNRRDEAIGFFRKEKTAWPESTVLMDKMIASIEANKPSAKQSETSGGQTKE